MRRAVLGWTEKAGALLFALLIAGILYPELASVSAGNVSPLVIILWIYAVSVPLVLILRNWTSHRRLWRVVGWCWMLFLLVWAVIQRR
jgi:hypothetical protein